MSRSPAWFGSFLLLITAPAAWAGPAQFVRPGMEVMGPGGYRADRFELRLKPAAAAIARATTRLAALATAPTDRPETTSLGIATLDHVAASVGVLSFEPEFRGETQQPVGSASTDFTAFYIATLAPDANIEQAMAALRALPDVESADPIAVLSVSFTPNDSLFASSWWFAGPPGISATQAWNLSTGDSTILIAVLDTGVLSWHPDLGGTVAGLPGQIWTNPGEARGTPGVDDDGNGFIDDIHGWDFVNLSGSSGVTPGEDWQYEDSDPNDYAGHGTLVAGLAAAITNDTSGVAGTAFHSRILPLRVGWSATGGALGRVDMSYVAQAIRYATKIGAQVLNCSFQTADLAGLMAAADSATRAGALIVTPAGNNGDGCPIPGSDCHELADRANVLTAGSLDSTGQVSFFSNTGEFVDVFAPGQGIQSTFLARVDTTVVPTYSPPIDGTSFSAPLAAGTAALVLAYDRAQARPPLRPMELLFRLRENADPLGTTTLLGTAPAGTAALRAAPTGTQAASGAVGQLNAAEAIANPHVSFAVRAQAQTSGAAVGLLTTGVTRIAVYATSDSALIYMSSRGDTLRRVPLGAGVVGSPASANSSATGGVGVFVALDNGTVAGFDGRGDALTGWPQATDVADGPPGAGPSLGDVDDDGEIEVVCPTTLSVLYVWHASGSRLTPFPVPTDDTGPVGTAALADLDGVPGLEIVLGTQGGKIYTYYDDPTTPLRPNWPRTLGIGLHAPIVMRLGLTATAIVATYGTSLRAYTAAGGILFTRALGAVTTEDPLAADVDGDGVDEILVPLSSPDAIAALDSTGTPLAGWSVTPAFGIGGPPIVRVPSPYSAASVAVLAPSGNRLFAYAPDGTARGEFPKPGGGGASPSLFDLGGDSNERVLAGTGPDSLIYFYVPPAHAVSPDLSKSWLTPRGNYARTGSRLAAPAPGVVNNVPAAVTDLAVISVTDTSVSLGWTATGDDSMTGRPKEYDVSTSWSTGALSTQPGNQPHWIFPATVDAGGRETALIGGLLSGTVMTFQLVARDAQGEQSLPSNRIMVRIASPGPLTGIRGPAVLSFAQPTGVPATIFWKAAPGMTRQTLSIYDVTGRLRRRFELGSGAEGSVVWNGADRSGEALNSGVYFLQLTSGPAHASGRIVLIR